jgi:FkbM family methyltransferase
MTLRDLARWIKRRTVGRFERRPDLSEWAERHEQVVLEDLPKVLPHIPDGGTFVDVGANIGLFTECVLRERPDASAWLFEPVSEYYEICVQRFKDNPRVHVEHLALGDHDGTAPIWKALHNPGANSMVREIMFDRREVSEVTVHTRMEEEVVPCRVFDRFAEERGLENVDFIKTDAEGFDYRILTGMLGFIERCNPRPVILAELMEKAYHPHWADQIAVVERLYALGYQKVDLSSMSKIDDLLFLPEGQGAPA